MLSDITIGQYYKGDSLVHKMDGRAKIVFTVLFVVMIFLCKNFLSLALVGAFEFDRALPKALTSIFSPRDTSKGIRSLL